MKITTVRAEVVEIKRRSDYAKKENGLTDYEGPKQFWYESELHILHNEAGMHGVLTVREKLEFEAIYEISFHGPVGSQVVAGEEFALRQENES